MSHLKMRSNGSKILIGIVALSILILNPCSMITPLDANPGKSYDQHWEIQYQGVVAGVNLIAPTSVVTMNWYWFNSSVEILSIDIGPPNNADSVFIFKISHLLITPGSLSAGSIWCGVNMTVGSRLRHIDRQRLSAQAVGLVPGASATLVYHLAVDLGVEDTQGTLSILNRTFNYEFEVLAGEDAFEYLLQLQQQQMMIYGIVGIIIVVVIIGVAFFILRKPKKEVL
ncbi:MAG: hypothetical protein ACFFCJ_07950 [Promethearchaeota archaeon]